jgi:hypothetical protein
MREALGYLRDVFDLPVPAAVLSRIRALPPSLPERIAEPARRRPSTRWGPWVIRGIQYLEYCSTLPPDAGTLRRVAALPSFFARRWRVPWWQMPFAAIFHVVRVLRCSRQDARRDQSTMAADARE